MQRTFRSPYAFLFAALLISACAPPAPPAAPTPSAPAVLAQNEIADRARQVSGELDDLHAAAAAADETRYFAHFAKSGVFLGTDAKERWDTEAFRAYAHPLFSAGKGWTYKSTRRAIAFTQDGNIAYFDEDLANDHIGPTRGSGVFIRENGRYLVAQYNLSLTIPNERVSAVRVAIETKDEPKPLPFHARYQSGYEKSVELSNKGDIGGAKRELLALVDEAKTHPENDLEFRLHNQLTWLLWAQNDLMGAIDEVEAGKTAILHSTLPDAEKRKLRLHELWDHAYLLLDLAMAQPAFSRAPTFAKAKDAKSEYDALAKTENDHDGASVLEAYFALKATKNKDAMIAAKKVDAGKDSDVQDLYVIEDALLAGGDKDGAAKVGTQICAARPYLMKPLILSRRKLEGRDCK